MEKNSKYLLKNIGLLTISQFATKVLTFFLVPLYTNILSTEEYGTYDLFSTTISLLIPIVTLNIAESIIVFALDKNKDSKNVFSVGLKYTFIGFIIVLGLSVINKLLGIIDVFNDMWYYLPLLLLAMAFSSVVCCFARGIEKIKETAISGVISSAVMIGLNILFLVVLKIGLHGYFLASIFGAVAQIVYLFISCKLWKYINKARDNALAKDMRKYSVPMMINSLGWWINSSLDRYIVTAFCGLAANGIYSVGYKIPQILNVFQTIFNSAWTISAVKDFDPEDKNSFFAKTYNVYNCGMTVICALIIATSRILAGFLYAKDFFTAWQYVPFLTIAIVFGAMSGHLGGIFSAVKASKYFAISTIAGAAVNLVLNIILIMWIGPIGAAIATAVSYLVVWILRLVSSKKFIKLKINLKRDIAGYCILIIETVLLFVFKDGFVLYVLELVSVVILVLIFKKELKGIVKKITRRLKRG